MRREEIERLERSVMSLVVQALRDYWEDATTIFLEETDQPQDIAEDITREAIATMGVSGTQDRLYGKVDVKKAIYAFLPDAIPVALMLDAKAEKKNGDRTATIQMSQTSMRVRLNRRGAELDESGKLKTTIQRGNRIYRVVTIIAKFVYEEGSVSSGKNFPEREIQPVLASSTNRKLHRIIVACIPSGDLQDIYNPTASDTIWLVGRDAPTLGEDFRVRINFANLAEKAAWRIHSIP